MVKADVDCSCIVQLFILSDCFQLQFRHSLHVFRQLFLQTFQILKFLEFCPYMRLYIYAHKVTP